MHKLASKAVDFGVLVDLALHKLVSGVLYVALLMEIVALYAQQAAEAGVFNAVEQKDPLPAGFVRVPQDHLLELFGYNLLLGAPLLPQLYVSLVVGFLKRTAIVLHFGLLRRRSVVVFCLAMRPDLAGR